MGSQMSAQERSDRAQVVVDNSGDVESLENNIRDLWEKRVKEKVGKV